VSPRRRKRACLLYKDPWDQWAQWAIQYRNRRMYLVPGVFYTLTQAKRAVYFYPTGLMPRPLPRP
jgi:hypothetical protein